MEKRQQKEEARMMKKTKTFLAGFLALALMSSVAMALVLGGSGGIDTDGDGHDDGIYAGYNPNSLEIQSSTTMPNGHYTLGADGNYHMGNWMIVITQLGPPAIGTLWLKTYAGWIPINTNVSFENG